MGHSENLVDMLVGIFIFVSLLGVIVTGLSGFNFANVTLGGTSYNLAWVPYLMFLLIVIGGIYFVMKNYKKA